MKIISVSPLLGRVCRGDWSSSPRYLQNHEWPSFQDNYSIRTPLWAIFRNVKIIIPKGELCNPGEDRLIISANKEAVQRLEKLFKARLEYF